MSDDGGSGPTVQDVLRIATRYLARRSASTLHLRQVLERKLRRGSVFGSGSPEADIGPVLDAVLARLTAAGLLDDASYAASRARVLAAKGLPSWRVRRELQHKGLDADTLSEPLALDAEAQARRYAERKRLGPFRPAARPASPERDLRALVRAGFSVAVARAVVGGSTSEDGSDEWRSGEMNSD